jgi:pimeloyl-ACP methyl ester carboxylesterase
VLAVDVVGRGRSSWLSDPNHYSLPVYVDHLKLFIEQLQLGSVGWVGTSMGGLIGMAVAASHPQNVNRLVLNDVGPFIPKQALVQLMAYVGVDLVFDSRESAEAHLRTIHSGFGPLTKDQWRELIAHSIVADADQFRLHYDPAIRHSYSRLAEANIDLWPVWEQIKCPVLLLRGELSPLLTRETAERMCHSGPKAKLVTFEGVGHAPALMADDQVSVVVDWLADQTAAI